MITNISDISDSIFGKVVGFFIFSRPQVSKTATNSTRLVKLTSLSFLVNNLLHSAQSCSVADYLQQVAYNSSLEDRNFPYRQKNTLSELIKIKNKSV